MTPAAERMFTVLEAAAAAGERCPMREQLGTGAAPSLRTLARAGKIRIEIFNLNFRRITILVGPHAGKATADPPLYNGKRPKPYMVSDANGTFTGGTEVNRKAGPRPTMMFDKMGNRIKPEG